MYRIAFLVVFSCFVAACNVQELAAQAPGGERGQRQRGQRPGGPPPAQPTGEQPAVEQPADEQPNGEQPSGEQPTPLTEGEGGAQPTGEPPYIPPPPKPANSLVKIIHPDVADRLALDDRQRAEAARIVNLQSLELSQATTPERIAEIYQQTEEKLKNLLSATQQAVLEQGLEAKTIRINFRNQLWKDVLQMIADQGKYQLILDAPPPGTFSFSSPETFTIIEALDLLNRNLITRGYTLTRQDNRILQLLNLRYPIPDRSFPTETPEGLAGRASSEYVSVIFPLERRDREKVIQGIEPLKSEYTRVAKVGGNEVRVIDTVETLNAVQRVIKSVNNPPEPKQPEPPKPPQPPKWENYTVEKNDPTKIEDIFKEYARPPESKIIRLAHSQELHVFARPDQHAQLKEILKMLEEDAGAGRTDSKLVSYSVSNYVEIPGFRGPRGQRAGGGERNFDPAAQFPTTERIQRFGEEIITMLKESFPKARISDAPVGDRIIVLATDAEHAGIKSFLEELRPSEESRLIARLYQFTEKGKKMNAETERQILALLPTARTTLDPERGEIFVIASVKEHEELRKIMKELEDATPATEERILQSYQLSASTIDTFWSLVSQLANQNQLRNYIPIRDRQRNQYLIWATATQHATIDKVYLDVTGQTQQTGGAPADAVVMFSPKNITLETLQIVITDIYPTAKMTADAQRKQMVIRVRPDQKEALQLLLEQLDAADPDEEKRYFDAYPIESGFYSISDGYDRGRPMELTAELEKIAPGASITWDAPSQKMIVWGTKEEHAKIKSAIQHLIGDGKDKVIERVQLRRVQAWTLTPVLRRMFPSVIPTPDNTGRVLILEGHAKLLPKVVELINVLDPEEPSENDPVVRFYKFEKEPSDRLLQGLNRLISNAETDIVRDPGNRQIMVIGRPADQKIIESNVKDIAESFVAPEKELRRFELRRFSPYTMRDIIRKKFLSEVEITTDYDLDRTLVIEADPIVLAKVAELIELLDPEKSSENDPVVAYYSLKMNPTYQVIMGLYQLAPGAQITVDSARPQLGQIMVIATPAEQAIIKKNVESIAASFAKPERTVTRFEIHRLEYWNVMGIITRLYPTSRISWDASERFIVVEAYPEMMPEITALVEAIDPKEPTENDPVAKFYPIRPEQSILEGIHHIAPKAQIVADHKQIMVIASPSDHTVIETNLELIAETFTALEDPVLCAYTVTDEIRKRLTSFMMETAVDDLRDAKIIPGTSDPSAGDPSTGVPRSPRAGGPRAGGATSTTPAASTAADDLMYIWARPTEHDLIATVLKQFKDGAANAPERRLKSFPMSVGDLDIAQSILRAAHPDAKLFPDETGNRLMVWATPEDMVKVTRTLRIQGSIDDREMIGYAVAVSPETVQTVITDVYKGLKISIDEKSRKVFVWASPEEHVRIGEIIEQANKEVDPDSELAESFQAYTAANLDPAMIMRLFQTIIPENSVYAIPGDDKIVVKALAREHKRIKELFTQLREKDETLRLSLVTYEFGETDPVMIEIFLLNQLKDAESMSPDELLMRASRSAYYNRMDAGNSYFYSMMYGRIYTPPKKIGFYKVDPQKQAVFVFATGEQHEEIKDAMEGLIAAGNKEGLKSVLKKYTLNESSEFYYFRQLLQTIAPAAIFQPLYDEEITPQGWYRSRFTGNLFVYTSEGEHAKLEAFFNEINDKSATSGKEMLTLTLPEKSPYSREKLIETIQKVYPDTTPMLGGATNQVLIWAQKYRLEKVQKIFDDVCQPLADGEQTIAKTYPLLYISVDAATAWLSALYPNAAFTTEKLTSVSEIPVPPTPQDLTRTDEAKMIVVVATPLEQVEIAKTIQELDKDIPDTHKKVQRTYLLEDVSAELFMTFHAALAQAFPNAASVPMPETKSTMIVATEDDHQRIADFVKTYRDDSERQRPVIETYTLERLNYWDVAFLLRRIAPPPAIMQPALIPERIIVRATPKEQRDIAEALAKMETAAAADLDVNRNVQVYMTGNNKAPLAVEFIYSMFSSVMAYQISPHEVIVWASPAVHDVIDTLLKDIAESYPESELRPYFFTHIPLGEAAATLQGAFVGQATIYQRPTTDDLMVFAMPSVHEKIKASIANFDIPRPAETESQSKAYDLSDLSATGFYYAMNQIPLALEYRVRVLQGISPNQLIVWGKPADLKKVDKIVEQILDERPNAEATTETYILHRGTAAISIQPMIQQLAPQAVLSYGTTPNHVLIWAKASDHRKIKEVFDRINESDADVTMKPYFFKHVPMQDGASILVQAFSASATLIPRYAAGELLVFASSNVHEQIAASLAEFDIPRPDGTEKVSKVYDISDLPATWHSIVMYSIQAALEYRVQVSGGIPGQITIWGRPADLEKADKMVADILAERPEVTTFAQVYTLHRGTNVTNVIAALPAMAPNAKYTLGTNPNQTVIWAREADHLKIAALVETLNESEPDIQVALHSLRNVSTYAAFPVLNRVIQERGLDVRPFLDDWGNRLVVLARAEDQKLVADILESLRAENRFMLQVALQNNDPTSVETAIDTMYYSDPVNEKPYVNVDANSNMVFIYGTEKQLEEIARMLRGMDEDVWYP
ncbi:MAG: hypothetical protein LBI05_04575, partial [Planctomycetaceae bacterium]|nr:hypothetical protein [Planctomycetaceae bacterium]